ncbi:murein L,D-transpeptidase [Paracoccus sp. (in: a-proteobacteria)]|uniref:L,D-transpeptidase family protein n=1 Tax=Paracoccus sp. TaxID=267 RepID=UPI0026E08E29|nr:L,D-transpeptidase family protein [Paracoccus sp. (in: a-proteobacteria)]MDO5646498.1 L,D-transpeptidase family protein [Paracoccus sp. (in: a-proteobacteria)]
MRGAIHGVILAVSCLVPVFAVAQTAPVGAAPVAAAPRLNFTPGEMAFARQIAPNPDLAAFYGSRGLVPVFTAPESAVLRDAVRGAINASARHGIPSARYDLDDSELSYARALALYLRDMTGGVIRPGAADPDIKFQPNRPSIPGLMNDIVADPAALDGVQPRHPAYLALQRALVGDERLAVPAHLPRVPSGLWRHGMEGDDVTAMRVRLASIGFDSPADDPRVYDDGLLQSVMLYQRAAGLPVDGVAGPQTIARLNGDMAQGRNTRGILIAMERLRWMPDADPMARQVWVNIPEYSTTIIDNGVEVFRTRSVVGKDDPDMRTPEFSDVMAHVVVNPQWNVPRSMTVRDYLPRLQANRNAVPHLEVVDNRGRVVPRDQIDFSRFTAQNFPYRLRQQPSDDNALGLVKFIFPNRWNIYLHDTPTKRLFGQQMRAHSNGCIRIGDPFDLAYALLSQQTDNPQAMFRRALDSKRETWLKLNPGVPVHLVYFTTWPDASGRLQTFPDVYGRDGRVWAAMQRAGIGG